jgi:hypothetical protein
LFSTLIGSLLAGFGNYRPDTFNKSAKNFGDPSGLAPERSPKKIKNPRRFARQWYLKKILVQG